MIDFARFLHRTFEYAAQMIGVVDVGGAGCDLSPYPPGLRCKLDRGLDVALIKR